MKLTWLKGREPAVVCKACAAYYLRISSAGQIAIEIGRGIVWSVWNVSEASKVLQTLGTFRTCFLALRTHRTFGAVGTFGTLQTLERFESFERFELVKRFNLLAAETGWGRFSRPKQAGGDVRGGNRPGRNVRVRRACCH